MTKGGVTPDAEEPKPDNKCERGSGSKLDGMPDGIGKADGARPEAGRAEFAADTVKQEEDKLCGNPKARADADVTGLGGCGAARVGGQESEPRTGTFGDMRRELMKIESPPW